MPRRQTLPRRWLLITDGNRPELVTAARKLPLGSGILLLTTVPMRDMRRLRQVAAARRLTIWEEKRGVAARVHNVRELRTALAARTKLILLSPIFPTATHPDWPAMPRMGAATLARLAGRKLVALGGMDDQRYAAVARLGFTGWAGVSAFRT